MVDSECNRGGEIGASESTSADVSSEVSWISSRISGLDKGFKTDGFGVLDLVKMIMGKSPIGGIARTIIDAGIDPGQSG